MTFSVLLAACGGGSHGGARASALASTINAPPGPFTADGRAVVTIGVTLRDTAGDKIRNSSAAVKISASPCSDCTLSYIDKNGTITGTLSSKAAEAITLHLSVNGTASPNTVTVSFAAGPPSLGQSSLRASPAS